MKGNSATSAASASPSNDSLPGIADVQRDLHKEGLRIRIRLYRWWDTIGLLFMMLAVGFIVFVLSKLLGDASSVDLLAWPVVGGFAALFVGLLYRQVARHFNWLTITLNATQLTVSQGPLPYWGGISVPVEEIDCLRQQTVRHHSSNGGNSSLNRSTWYTERLSAVTLDGAQRVIHEDHVRQLIDWLAQELVDFGSFSLLSRDSDESPHSFRPPRRVVSDETAPPNITCVPSSEGQRIGIRWFRISHLVSLVICALLAVPVSFAWLMAIALLSHEDGVVVLAVLVPLIFTIVIGCVAYGQIASFFNRTWFFVEDNQLVLEHGPLAWPGARRIPVHSIKRLAAEYQRTSESTFANSMRCFTLTCHYADGTSEPLYGGLTPESATFIADAINRQLSSLPVDRYADSLNT